MDYISKNYPNYEVELLEAHTQLPYRVTKNFRYTLEVRSIRVYFYRINWTPSKYERFTRAYDCTMYATREEAEHDAKRDTRGRGWFITREKYDTFETQDHRYKVRA